MSEKVFAHDIGLAKVGQLLNVRIHNVSTAQRGTLAGLLTAANDGLHVWDTDLKMQYYWDGANFVQGVSTITGAMVYKGAYASLTVTPSALATGHVYVMTAAGTLTWATQTFSPSADVQVGDQVVYRAADAWDVVQGNAVAASETVAGIIMLATTASVIAGTDALTAITPAALTAWRLSTDFVVKLSAAFSSTSVARETVTGWTVAVEAGRTYRMRVLATYQTVAASTGGSLGLAGVGAAAGTLAGEIRGGTMHTATATNELVVPVAALGASLTTTSVAAINTPHHVSMDVVFYCTASGSVSVQWGTEIAGSAAQLNAGSALFVETF